MSNVLQCTKLSKFYQQGTIETKVLNELDLSVECIVPCYCKVSKLVGLDWLIEETEKVTTNDHWSRLARFSLLLDLLEFREKLVVKIVKSYQNEVPDTAIELWTNSKASDLNRVKRVIDDIKTQALFILISFILPIDKYAHCLLRRRHS